MTMNTSKALNILLAVALLLLSVRVAFFDHAGCGDNEPMTPAAATDSVPAAEADNAGTTSAQWQEATASDIKNPFELFGKDWMALAAGHRGDMNAMTIAWGTIGRLWQRDVVIVYVSSSRYTFGFMERNRYFTVTAFPESMRSALQYIGTHSARDEADKIAKAGLTPEFTELGNPIFREANLAIECRIIYKQPFRREAIDSDVATFYDNGTGIHSMYIGEIVHVWKK